MANPDNAPMIRQMIENANLREQLSDKNYILLFCKLVLLPEDAEDRSDEALCREILRRLNPDEKTTQKI